MKSNLKRLRKEAGLTMEQLANMSGTVKSHVFALEKPESNPTLETAYRISGALRVKVFDIWKF